MYLSLLEIISLGLSVIFPVKSGIFKFYLKGKYVFISILNVYNFDSVIYDMNFNFNLIPMSNNKNWIIYVLECFMNTIFPQISLFSDTIFLDHAYWNLQYNCFAGFFIPYMEVEIFILLEYHFYTSYFYLPV